MRTEQPLFLTLVFVSLITACGDPASCEDSERQAWVVSALDGAPIEGDVSVGFDLDNRVSDASDPLGCQVVDLVHPDGTPGIDNAMGKILPALDSVGGEAVGNLVLETINSGELLLLFQLEGLDDPSEDDCVQLRILRGAGVPGLGGDGRIQSGQTFDQLPGTEPILLSGLVLQDGRVRASGFEMDVPVTILGRALEFTLRNASLELLRLPDGRLSGVLAGGVSSQQIRQTAAAVDEGVEEAVEAVLDHNADLEPNAAGYCEAASLVLEFQAVSAFLFDDAG
ncbi:MAG: hypothetical protein VX498_08250 [Myxococcota bacterium]|nr:hypothetical protein [Myxococcota bacterium]